MVVILLFGLHARGNRPCNFLSKATKQTLKKTILCGRKDFSFRVTVIKDTLIRGKNLAAVLLCEN